MKNISLKIDDSIFSETERLRAKLDVARNRYINQALDFYNAAQKRRVLRKQLAKESMMVREESMKFLVEFEGLDDSDPAV